MAYSTFAYKDTNIGNISNGTILTSDGNLTVKENGKTIKVEKRNTDLSVYTSKVDKDNIETELRKLMNKYPNTKQINDKNPNYIHISPGEYFKINPTNNGNLINIFALTDKKNSNYFDLVIILTRNDIIIDFIFYNKTNKFSTGKNKVIHSGDIGSLLHYITNLYSCENDIQIHVCAIGYNLVPLEKFKIQVPNVCIVNYNEFNEPEDVLIISCPLEQAIIGNSNFIILCTIYNNDKVLYVPYTQQINKCSNLNLSVELQKNNSIKELIKQTIVECDLLKINLQTTISDSVPIQDIILQENIFHKENIPQENISHKEIKKLLYITQDSNNEELLKELKINNNYKKHKIDAFPFSEKVSGGISVLGITLFPDINFDELNCKKAIIILKPNKWNPNTRSMICDKVLNGVYICILSDYDNADRISLMNEMLVNFFSIVGKKSIIICKIGSKYYWFDGVIINGLIDNIPNYGDEIIDLNIILSSWIDQDTEENIWYEQNILELNDYITITKNIINDDKIDLKTKKDNFRCITFELKSANSKIVEEYKKELLLYCNELIKNFKKEEKMILDNHLDDSMNIDDCHKIINKLAIIKKNKKFAKELYDIISILYTNKSSSSNKNSSIKQELRVQTMKDNIKKAQDLTLDDYLEIIETYSLENISCLYIELTENFFSYIMNGIIENNSIEFQKTYLTLDATTTSSMLELLQKKKSEYFSETKILLVPNNSNPVLPIIIVKEALNKFHELDYQALQQNTKFALFRISLRGLISGIRYNDKVAFDGNASSSDLTKFLIDMFIKIQFKLCSRITSPNFVYDDSLPTIIRGMMLHMLTIMASGSKPYSEIYKIFYDNLKNIINFKVTDWCWIISIMKILKNINYPEEYMLIVRKNLKMSFINYIIRMILPEIEESQKQIKFTKIKKNNNSNSLVDKKLQWYRMIASVYAYMEKENIPITKEIVIKILEYKPIEYNSEPYLMKQYNIYLKTGKINHELIKETIANIVIKRSALLKSLKTNAVKKEILHSTFVDKQKKEIKNIADIYNIDIDVLKTQNKKLDDENTYYNSLKGDEELNRNQWLLTQEELNKIDKTEMDERIKYILNTSISSSVKEIKKKTPLTLIKKKENNIIEKLINGTPSPTETFINYVKHLYEINDVYDKFTYIQSHNKEIMSIEILEELCSILNINNNKEFINEILKISILNWFDKNKAIELIYLYFK